MHVKPLRERVIKLGYPLVLGFPGDNDRHVGVNPVETVK